MSTKGLLGDYPLLASMPVRWTMREGVRPVIETYDMKPDHAQTLIDGPMRPVELVVESTQGEYRVKNLWVLHVAPADNPYVSRVTVADRRWMWSYGHTLRRYNIRRNIGTKGIERNDLLKLQDIIDAIWYAPFSLNPPGTSGRPWKAKDALQDVIEDALRVEEETFGSRATLKPFSVADEMPIEDLEIDDTSDAAVARALAYCPAMMIWLDLNGDVRVSNKSDGGEAAMVERLKPDGGSPGGVVNGGQVVLLANRRIRPREVRVLFTREVEVRFDFIETSTVAGATTADIGETRRCENVIPIPDPLGITVAGKKTPQGTFITIDQLLGSTEWANGPGIGGAITHTLIQRAFVPYMDLWAALELSGQRVANADWSIRLAALQQHYRRTFRVNPRWMDRIISLRAYRVATVDQAKGQRAPAPAYADFAYIPGQKHFWKVAQRGGKDLSFAENVKGYPLSGNLDPTTRATPSDVSIADEDQGIVHVDYRIDPFRNAEQALPSMVEIEGSGRDAEGYPLKSGPSGDITDLSRPIGFNTVVGSTGYPKLTSDHKIAFIVTAVPAAPNSELQLHRIVVKPQDIAHLLPGAAKAGLGDAVGPPMEIRVGARTEVARIRWIDSQALLIEELFGLRNPPPDAKPLDERVRAITLNEDDAGASELKAGSLNRIAHARSAALYASLCDRLVGAMAGAQSSGVEPAGWLSEAATEIDAQGAVLTRINLPERIPEFSLLSYLDPATRAVILRQVQPPR